jgi:hypothetical protein
MSFILDTIRREGCITDAELYADIAIMRKVGCDVADLPMTIGDLLCELNKHAAKGEIAKTPQGWIPIFKAASKKQPTLFGME